MEKSDIVVLFPLVRNTLSLYILSSTPLRGVEGWKNLIARGSQWG